MGKSLLFFLCLFMSFGTNAQEVLPELSEKRVAQVKLSIEQDIKNLKIKSKFKDMPSYEVEFYVDTFRIEQLLERCLNFEMSNADRYMLYEQQIKSYESLVTKYYFKLLSKLSIEDKKKLTTALDAWKQYNKAQMDIIWLFQSDAYTIGGTVQIDIAYSKIIGMVKSKVEELYDYYSQTIPS